MNDELIASFGRSKRAANRSQSTIDSYTADLRHLIAWLPEGVALVDVTRRHLDDYLAGCLEQGLAPATVGRRYRSFLQFFRWALDEEEIDVDPMAKMKPPKQPVTPPPVIPPADLDRLLAVCDEPRRPGNGPAPTKLQFENKRDKALILTLATTGVRASELVTMTLDRLDLNSETVTVIGKGDRLRIVALMPKTADAIDKYLRHRRRHRLAHLDALWLGTRGPLTDNGLRQMIERRCDDAGLARINPHRFRHTFAHEAKSRGMQDGDLMAIAGWQSPQMLHRYGASAAAERARDAHRRLFGKD